MQLLQIKSIHNTTNPYVKRSITIKNLESIDKLLNNRKGLNISQFHYQKIIDAKKQQKQQLKSINKQIEIHEIRFQKSLF